MGDKVEQLLVLGCQHSISTAVAPSLVKALSNEIEARIRLRSANRDECYSLLLSGEADIVLMYRTKHELPIHQASFLEIKVVGEDEFIPIVAKATKLDNWENTLGG
jgi:DNA-binding transcriptional LysR family regulator